MNTPEEPDGLAETLESTTDPAFAVDADGLVVGWNSAAETALGHAREQVLGSTCHEVVGGTDLFGDSICKRECLVLRNARQKKAVARFRVHVHSATGHRVEMECSTLRIPVSPGRTVVVHLLQDRPDHAPGTSLLHSMEGRNEHRATSSLTPREREVLALLASGRSTTGIAGELFVSPATVRTHIENILRKLDVHSRLEAVSIALADRLV